ncbi:MAG: T9SS type A sorting domain-containing protein, partial [Bacteroidales bacterium]|nr:T9SS type A sorting domain-containing protein [Bacteroidales bacterium]
DASGNMGLMMAKPTSYSGSWDTLQYVDIDITDVLQLSIQFGFGKRNWGGSSVDTAGINVEVSIDGGEWIQLDTSLLPSPLALGTWSWVEIPLPAEIVGETMDIRFANWWNICSLDDITVMGYTVVPEGFPPSTPANLAATISETQDTVILSWDASIPGDTTAGIAGYILTYNEVVYDTVLALTDTLFGLHSGDYILGVSALDSAGLTSDEATVEFRIDIDAPTAPFNLSLKYAGDSLTIKWFAASDNFGIAGYTITQDAVEIGTTPSLIYVVKGLAAGDYLFGVSAFDAFDNQGSEVTKSITITGVKNISVASLKIYPNPVFNQLNIECDQSIELVKITDVAGKTIFNSNKDIKVINTSDLKQGIYIIQVFTKTNTYTSTFIKK